MAAPLNYNFKLTHAQFEYNIELILSSIFNSIAWVNLFKASSNI